MGPLQDYENEHLVATDKPIAMTRRALYDAAVRLQQGVEPPALTSAVQGVRAAGVLLDRSIKAQDWARDALSSGPDKPVYSV